MVELHFNISMSTNSIPGSLDEILVGTFSILMFANLVSAGNYVDNFQSDRLNMTFFIVNKLYVFRQLYPHIHWQFPANLKPFVNKLQAAQAK